MNKKDYAILKVLADLNRNEPDPELTPEQEKLFNRALNPDSYDNFLLDVEELFKKPQK